jgi:predicted kinase
VYQTRQDDAFSVSWECWDDFDFGEKEFVRRMGDAGVTLQQAFAVLYLSHRNRTQIGVIEIEAFKAQSGMKVNLPTIPQSEIQQRITHAQQLIRSLNATPNIVPQAKRLASCAVSDIQHSTASQKQEDTWLALRWARNAETTILSAKALQELSEKRKHHHQTVPEEIISAFKHTKKIKLYRLSPISCTKYFKSGKRFAPYPIQKGPLSLSKAIMDSIKSIMCDPTSYETDAKLECGVPHWDYMLKVDDKTNFSEILIWSDVSLIAIVKDDKIIRTAFLGNAHKKFGDLWRTPLSNPNCYSAE